jgi:Zn-dependent M28 family amino/carboxypeptidase
MQRFTAQQKSQPQPVDMANLIVSWYPERQRRVILCAHYDTRPIADNEPDRRKWRDPFLSANDGGSGVALLMELAHHMKDLKTGVGVDFVFFDGEEYVFNPVGDLYFFGSEHFAQDYQKSRPRYRYTAAVLLDMIGGKNAHFPIEQNSFFLAAELVKEIWQVAAEQKCAAFENEPGPDVRDDHLALNKAKIPAVDIIDFQYPHWHRLSDVPANCSGDSLYQVARVLTAWLQRQK